MFSCFKLDLKTALIHSCSVNFINSILSANFVFCPSLYLCLVKTQSVYLLFLRKHSILNYHQQFLYVFLYVFNLTCWKLYFRVFMYQKFLSRSFDCRHIETVISDQAVMVCGV